MNINLEIQNEINQDFITNFKNAIISRDRWNALNRSLDIFSHLCSATGISLAFVAGSIHLPIISLFAGGFMTVMTISNSYSKYCQENYKTQSEYIKEMSKEINANDILIDEPQQPPNSQTNN